MTLPKLPRFSELVSPCYRNVATIKDSQDLFDDLTGNPTHIPLLQKWADGTSGINHDVDAKERPFQYSLPEFKPEQWYRGRFGDGELYGVWYGALEKETSIEEALFWQYRNFYKPMLQIVATFTVDRRMLEASVSSKRAMDLRELKASYSDLQHDTDYKFCHELGAHAIASSIDLYLTPSARKAGGTCVPIFNSKAITSTKTLYYLHFKFTDKGRVTITSDEDKVFEIPGSW